MITLVSDSATLSTFPPSCGRASWGHLGTLDLATFQHTVPAPSLQMVQFPSSSQFSVTFISGCPLWLKTEIWYCRCSDHLKMVLWFTLFFWPLKSGPIATVHIIFDLPHPLNTISGPITTVWTFCPFRSFGVVLQPTQYSGYVLLGAFGFSPFSHF